MKEPTSEPKTSTPPRPFPSTEAPVVARPFLKWAGGKTALLPKILPLLPAKINTYYEPFVGAGAVFFALANEKRFTAAWLGDANEELIDTYIAVRDQPEDTVDRLRTYASSHCETHFYEVREKNPKKAWDYCGIAARMIYLNRTCFNGLYRVNKKGKFNVPFGAYKNPTICDEVNLLACSLVMHSTGGLKGFRADFEATVADARRGDAVYFDPPYIPLSPTSNFTAYAKGGFGEQEHIRLRDCFAALDARGVHVLLSNSDTPLVRKLYKGFKLEEVQAPRRVNSKGGKRGNVGELLISGKNTK